MELVRTDRINVVYILNLLRSVQRGDRKEGELEADLDLVLREIERSDNESLRAKKDVMAEFIRTRFYDLPEDTDMMAAFEDFAQEFEKEEIKKFACENEVEESIIQETMAEYSFNGSISDEDIRKRLTDYKYGLLKTTKLTRIIKNFVERTYGKYKAEGE